MTILIDSITILLPLFYLVTVWTYAEIFFNDSAGAQRIATPFLCTTAALHAIYLLVRTEHLQHPPITSAPEIMTVIAFSIAAAYIIIEFRSKAKGTGFFILGAAVVFQVNSSLFIQDTVEVNPVLRSSLLGIHVSTALLGYSAITISAVYGFLYLMLYHNIKANRFGPFYSKLPNLEMLERMSSTAAALGFALLTIAIVVGLIWLRRAFTEASYADPKLIGTIVVWFLYGIGLFSKRSWGWQGRKNVILSIVGFLVSVFSLTVVNMFFSNFHNFY